jgi:Na+-driven multidrug efflux pump
LAESGNYELLTAGPVRRVILTLAVPTIVSMLITSIYNIASTFYVGRISPQATAAVGIAFSYMAVVQAIGFMFGQGSGNYISRELGARNRENAGRMSIVGFVLAIATGLLFSVLGFVFLRPLCMLLGSTETILPDAERYMRWVLASTPFMCGAFVLNNQMRFQATRSMRCMELSPERCFSSRLPRY